MVPTGFDSTILEEESPIRTQIANRAAFEFEPYHEHENNEDQKTPGYPDGPIAIYSDNVYLYLEPTAEEAAKFDVVINVAREVNNPFKALAKQAPAVPEKVTEDSPIPDTAVTAASFATAFEFLPEDGSVETPTTPKPTPLKEPEYIHMPWDHNTDISHDLLTLCETIERKTKEGKKVLVHCQQGASRSASLIIAYGIWQNPELSVNDAYYAAQAKSRWISPNMRLMYCLQDFQKEVAKRWLSPGSAFKSRSGKSPTKHRTALSVDAIDIPQSKEPLTAPLPNEEASPTSANQIKSPTRGRGSSSPGQINPISPPPSSAPSSFSWSEKEDENDPGKFGRFNLDAIALGSQPNSGGLAPPPISIGRPPPSPGFAPLSLSGHSLSSSSPSPSLLSRSLPSSKQFGGFFQESRAPIHHAQPSNPVVDHSVTIMRGFPDDSALLSPRAEVMTMNPLHESLAAGIAGLHLVEVPPTPSDDLFSPRQSMFPRDPFYPFGRPSQVADPRSPPTKGETPIVRSIDEML
jgi:tyrosine-protein phosphatase